MKIVYVSSQYEPITSGDIGTYIANVTQCMLQRGHEVYLITDCFNDSNLHYLPTEIKLIPIEPTLPERQGRYFAPFQEYSDRVYQTLTKLCQITQIDVVEFAERGAEGFMSIRAKKLLNEFAETKLIVKLHTPTSLFKSISEDTHKDYYTELTIYAENYSVQNADIVASSSNSLAQYFQTKLGITSIVKSSNLLDAIAPSQPRVFKDDQIKKVIFTGDIDVLKGVDFFIEAAISVLRKEPDFIFEIYGEDTDSAPFKRSFTEYLKKKVPKEFKNNILFYSARPSEQIKDVLLNSCFCVFPSRWENYSNIWLKAMSVGSVVIGTKYGVMSEIIDNGISGFLVDPYKPEEIAQAILDNYKNHSRLQEISQAAQTTIEQSCNIVACQQIESSYQIDIHRNWLVNQNPKVSVVIPLYNQGQYIQETIDSVKESTYKNIEIVIVNDGSTDEFTNQVFEHLEGVVKVSKLNGGLSSARNAGIKASSGEFVFPLDSDDKIHPNYITEAVNCLQNNPELSYVGCWNQDFGLSTLTWLPPGFINGVSFLKNTISSCAALFRKTVLETIGGYDEKMIAYEDWEMYVRLEKNGFTGDVLPRPYLYYRIKPQSESMQQSIGFPKHNLLQQYILKQNQHQLSNEELIYVSQLLIDLWNQEQIIRLNDNNWFWGQIELRQQEINLREQEIQSCTEEIKLREQEIKLYEQQIELREKRIVAMESSKFWQLRKGWFKIKRRLGLTAEEL